MSGQIPRGRSYERANPKWHLPKGCKRQFVDIRITCVLVRFSKVHRAPPTLTDSHIDILTERLKQMCLRGG